MRRRGLPCGKKPRPPANRHVYEPSNGGSFSPSQTFRWDNSICQHHNLHLMRDSEPELPRKCLLGLLFLEECERSRNLEFHTLFPAQVWRNELDVKKSVKRSQWTSGNILWASSSLFSNIKSISSGFTYIFLSVCFLLIMVRTLRIILEIGNILNSERSLLCSAVVTNTVSST